MAKNKVAAGVAGKSPKAGMVDPKGAWTKVQERTIAKKGAMVKFEHGTEFVPHKELRDAHQYWKDEDEAMRKERDKPKMKLEET